MKDGRYLNAAETARRLGVDKSTVTRWIAAGAVPAVRVGGRWRINAGWVKQELERVEKP